MMGEPFLFFIGRMIVGGIEVSQKILILNTLDKLLDGLNEQTASRHF